MIDVSRHGAIAVITIDNPPVNAMSPGVPQGIIDAVTAANGAPDVTAMVLRGGGKGNIAGADIRFQGSKWPDGEPTLRDLIVALEDSTKPVVAALGPHTLGGGLELAMACAYRVIAADGQVGQPEVNLGIPPGAGATQRLPRLVGADRALSMIVGGKPVAARDALAAGIVDKLIEQDGIEEAVRFAADLDSSPRRTRDLKLDAYRPELFEAMRGRIRLKQPRLNAPLVCIDCVEAAYTRSFPEALAYERQRFEECVVSEEAAALRHVFFAERQAGKLGGVSADSKPVEVEEVAVIGAGTMGSGIAIALLKAGYRVTLIEQDPAAQQRGGAHIDRTLARDVERGRLTAEQKREIAGRLTPSSTLDAAKTARLVIEAVYEDMDIKKTIFARLGELVPDAVLATNTSYLDVDEIALAAGPGRARVVGMHFFSPANLMRLLEVVRGKATSEQAVLTALAVGRRVGKVAIVAGVCHGFIANRMYQAYLREAYFLIEEGALPAQVDAALTEFGFAMGPFAVSDLAGLDIGWANRKAQAANRDPAERYAVVADRICERGWFGQKSGRGFYRYEEGSRQPVVDPEISALIEAASRDIGMSRRQIADREIVERCVYGIVNEGARILAEGIAARSSDLDLAWLHGYGFPRWRGGPMFYAQRKGLTEVIDRLRAYQPHSDALTPSGALVALEESG